MKFYKYLIYKLYSWGLKRENDTPVFNVIITLTFVHFVQLFTVYMVLLKYMPEISIFNMGKKIYLYVFGVAFIVLNYFVLYNKKRWDSYLQEYKNESKNQSRKGKIVILSYLIGSILLFFITSIMLFT